MSAIVLFTGGTRSGKSSYAESRAENIGGRKVYVATCPKIDPELNSRIRKHILARKNKGWHTVEEELDITKVVTVNHDADVIMVDCLTLWINNLLYTHNINNSGLGEERITALCHQLLNESRRFSGTIFFVTNEVGSGIVPESSLSRLYRDLVGRCNQTIAQAADEVVFVSCGIPLTLKSQH